MRKLTVLLLCCFIFLSVAATAQRGIEAVPEGANLEQYPLFDHPLTTKDQAKLSLHPMILDQPWTGYNWYRGKQRFVLETLSVGTLVFADTTGKPIYKADCANRLVELRACPKCAPTVTYNTPATPTRSTLDRFWDFLKGLWQIIGAILLLLLLALLIAALLYGIYRLLDALFNREPRDRRDPSVVPYPGLIAPMATTPTPASATPRAATVPVSTPTSTQQPIADAPLQRRFVAVYFGNAPADEIKVRSRGCGQVFVEQVPEDGTYTTTIRIR